MIAEGLHAGAGGALRISAMLSEEGLLVVIALIACGAVILGVWNLLSPTRPRHPERLRTPALPRAARPNRQSALARHAKDRGRTYPRLQTPLTPSPVPLAPLSPSLLTPATAPPDAARTPRPGELVAAESTAVEAGGPALDLAPAAPEVALEAAPPTLPESAPLETIELPSEDESVVEICFTLYQEQRYLDVIDRATDALTAGPDGRPLTDLQADAALWSVVALARQALGEDTGARTALENAIAAAPDGDRPTYQRQLASLAESVAQGLLAEDMIYGRIQTGVATFLPAAPAEIPFGDPDDNDLNLIEVKKWA